MNTCIICGRSDVPFESVEHIIPEKLGNTELTLRGVVCDLCNKRFGGALDSVFTQRAGKSTFDNQPSKEHFIGMELHPKEAEKRLLAVMEREDKKAAERDERNGTVIIRGASNNDAEKTALLMADLFARDPLYKYGVRGLFAIVKICVEYLYYICDKKGVNAVSDPFFRRICLALHEYTKTQRIQNYKTVNKKASAIWPISDMGKGSDYSMYFEVNNVWQKMSVNDYVDYICQGEREKLVYCLQIINLQGYVGVLAVLGGISPVIGVVGSSPLASRLGIRQDGKAMLESSKFRR